jgi:hypothetical protein
LTSTRYLCNLKAEASFFDVIRDKWLKIGIGIKKKDAPSLALRDSWCERRHRPKRLQGK